ncbi:MAG: hypothetical protein SynsKO_05190 [Synoicihabitans sp.]
MLETITLILAVLLLVVTSKLWGHRKAVRTASEAMKQRQPLLRDEHPGAAGRDWEAFRNETNRMIEEINALETSQTSHLAQLEATLGSLKEAVLVVDSHNHILLANRSLQDIFPKATQIIDQRLEVVLHSVAFLNYVESVRAGEADPHYEVEFVETDETRWVEVTGTSIPALDGSGAQWLLFVLHDVTRQKSLERVRKEFVANVSHELRTPLAVIKGYIETLVDGHQEMDIADRARFLATVQRHTERLNSLLEDLLTLSRLESVQASIERESIELHSFIDTLLAEYQGQPASAKHTIETHFDPAVTKLIFDPLKLSQVFNNLIDNALKYTPAGSIVSIGTRLRQDQVEITVRDDGGGIPATDLPHIFERFYRVEKGRSREKGGTGLGLSIVKHIVQLHGGSVRVESDQQGQGTAFILSLPLHPAI